MLWFRRENSRVGRRIVVAFLVFALLPLVGFAAYAHHHVAVQLTASAKMHLRGAATTAGVILTERLTLAANELAGWDGQALDGTRAGRQAIAETQPAAATGLLDAAARRDLDALGVVLRARRSEAGVDLWLMVRGQGAGAAIAGRVDPEFLYDPDGLQRPPIALSVHTSNGTLLHGLGLEAPSVATLREQGLGHTVRGALRWPSREDERVGEYREVFLKPQFGMTVVVAAHDSRARILEPLSSFAQAFFLVVLLATLGVVLAALVRVRRIMRPVGSLVAASKRIARYDFTTRVDVHGSDEFSSLGQAFNSMTADLQRRAALMGEISAFGRRLVGQLDIDALLGRLRDVAASMFGVDGVLIHTADESHRFEPRQLRVRSLGLGKSALPDTYPDLHTDAEEPLTKEQAEQAVRALLHELSTAHGYLVRDVAILPMRDHEGHLVGSLTLFNPQDAEGRPATLGSEIVALAEAMAGQAAVALTNARLVHEFKGLFDAIIDMLAMAVDEKSPYTGDHCRRVPNLAMMILEAVDTATDGPLSNCSFTEKEVYEMQVASLLHDCGKVVTPVHVIDKATKLETIYDRIGTVDARFSLAAWELEAKALREAAVDAGVELEDVDRRIVAARDELREERAFLRRVNQGGEYMLDKDVSRVDAIRAGRRWTDLDGEGHDFLDEDEAKNLAIRKGTITDGERRIVNGHMDVTIRMLEQLPFPRGLRRVPEIAGSHHERMDGGGFPRGLAGRAIPLRGRILAVADVFEALTARDRPYKEAKTVSQALRIMGSMARDGHLDPDVFGVFLDARVWQRYADETLSLEQHDEVDVAAIREIFETRRASAPTA